MGNKREYKPRTQYEKPVDPIRVPGKFVIQWGAGPKIEFYRDHDAMARRFNYLLDNHHTDATARTVTWSDVVLHYAKKK